MLTAVESPACRRIGTCSGPASEPAAFSTSIGERSVVTLNLTTSDVNRSATVQENAIGTRYESVRSRHLGNAANVVAGYPAAFSSCGAGRFHVLQMIIISPASAPPLATRRGKAKGRRCSHRASPARSLLRTGRIGATVAQCRDISPVLVDHPTCRLRQIVSFVYRGSYQPNRSLRPRILLSPVTNDRRIATPIAQQSAQTQIIKDWTRNDGCTTVR